MGRAGQGKRVLVKVREMQYDLSVVVTEYIDAIATLRKEAGCFVMLSNVPKDEEGGYDARLILKAYKDQHGIEQRLQSSPVLW